MKYVNLLQGHKKKIKIKNINIVILTLIIIKY